MRSRSGWFGVLISTALLVAYPLPAGARDSGGHGGDHGGDHGRGVVVRQDNLVSDQPGHAALTDPNLVNAWGMSHGPSTPLWVSDNGADVTTLYRGAVGGAPVAIQPLVVGTPGGAPTGQVFNDTGDFVVPGTGRPALFIFAGEDGDLSAWNQAVSPATMAISVGHTEGAVYKGLALSHSPFGSLLLAANFHANRIDVFDASFQPIIGDELFRDPSLPAGYAPFNVTTIGNHVFVTYAKQDATAHDDVAGPGHGFIDVFTSSGGFLSRFAGRGVLDSPWGMAIAPSSFGAFAGALLVGNFGDGRIHAFDVRTGRLLGTLRNSRHRALRIDGLWGLIVGDPVAGGPQAVWFSAGPDGEAHGLLGTLTAG